ncbi:WhiB family transcriptional regulator [Streptomyces triculaminicus]|uniref:WhiB family transcriptional regulator n=1 Tax=Streptomyces triculaminicus TaxID=2816232 RepID=UPI0033E0F26D
MTTTTAADARPRSLTWRDSAACQGIEDPELFFPEAETATAIQEARRFCVQAGCPVITECLLAALEREGSAIPKFRYGVWGAAGPTDRYRLYLQARKDKAA